MINLYLNTCIDVFLITAQKMKFSIKNDNSNNRNRIIVIENEVIENDRPVFRYLLVFKVVVSF